VTNSQNFSAGESRGKTSRSGAAFTDSRDNNMDLKTFRVWGKLFGSAKKDLREIARILGKLHGSCLRKMIVGRQLFLAGPWGCLNSTETSRVWMKISTISWAWNRLLQARKVCSTETPKPITIFVIKPHHVRRGTTIRSSHDQRSEF